MYIVLIDNNVNTQTDTEIVHIGRKFQNQCAVMVSAGKRSFKAIWDSGAGRCVIFISVQQNFIKIQIRSLHK